MAGGQDLFDAIVMADDRFHGQGYQEGYEEGSSLGIIEGRQHGTLHGAKIGSEVGCYQGFAFAWRGLLRSHATGKDRVIAMLKIVTLRVTGFFCHQLEISLKR
ncbi:protein LTO1 homolog isoform X6 [Pteropus medius]|uniref:protein LTO1 homolog isoform X6 n=1 Tax=Pteropus vampyrus TaxID=132908 RepID=UPI00196B04D4|nr:protein LTO1 homolog isoform X6 [Pteropus giganteus]